MLTFMARAATAWSRLTVGTQNGPIAAGVRSIMTAPCPFTLRLFSSCTYAEVASKQI
jgi:hypothetical protein